MLSFQEFGLILEAAAKEVLAKHPQLEGLGLSPKHLTKYGMALGKMKDLPDAEKVKSTLSDFDTHGSKLEGKLKDFGNHPSFEHVQNALQPHVEKAAAKKATKSKADEESPVVFDNGKGLKVRHITTPEAAKGPHCQGTKWCVTSKNNSKSFFDEYSKGGQNKMYVIHTPDGKKYAYHEGENAVIRREDDSSKPILDLVKEHPDLQKSETLRNSKWGAFFGNKQKFEELRNNATKKDASSTDVRTAAKHPEIARELMNSPSYKARSHAAQHHDIAKELMEGGEKNSNVLASIGSYHHDLAKQLMNHPDEHVRATIAFEHPDLAGQMLNDKSTLVQKRITKHRQYAVNMIDHPDPKVRASVAYYHEDLAEKLKNDKDPNVRVSVAKHPKHAIDMMNDKNRDVRDFALNTIQVHAEENPPEKIADWVNHPHPWVRETAARYHPEHAAKLTNDPNGFVASLAKRVLKRGPV